MANVDLGATIAPRLAIAAATRKSPQTSRANREGRARCHSRQSTGLKSSDGPGKRRVGSMRASSSSSRPRRLRFLATFTRVQTARSLKTATATSTAAIPVVMARNQA